MTFTYTEFMLLLVVGLLGGITSLLYSIYGILLQIRDNKK